MEHKLRAIPAFNKLKFNEGLMDIAMLLEEKLYLKDDYIIQKDDIGEEMFFIVKGSVKIMAEDEKTILKILGEGKYFGEIALTSSKRRTASVIADSTCVLYILRKDDIDEIFKNFPKLKRMLKRQGNKRIY